MEQPWGSLLGTLAAREASGEVTIDAAGKRYAIELHRGTVVGASSPLASDALVRIALTSHLVTPVYLGQITRALAAPGGRDEFDVIADVARLSPEHVATLRTRAILQRAARTFAVDGGEVAVREYETPPREPAVALEAVVFHGAHLNLSETRLASELRAIGGAFRLVDGAGDRLARFALTAPALAVAQLLRGAGTTLAEIEARHRDIDPRIVAATTYALAVCGAAVATAAAPAEARARTASVELKARTASAPDLAARTSSAELRVTVRTPAARTIGATMPPANVPRTSTGGQSGLPAASRAVTGPTEMGVPRTATGPGSGQVGQGAASGPAMPRTLTGPTETGIPRTLTPPTTGGPAMPRTLTPPAMPRTLTPPPAMTRAQTPPPVARATTVPPLRPSGPSTQAPNVPRTMTPPATFRAPTARPTSPSTQPPNTHRTPSRASSPAISRTLTPRWTAESIADLEATVVARLAVLDQGGDYFSMLGLVFDAPVEACRIAHAPLARALQPELLAEHASPALQASGARLLEHLTIALETVTDPTRRSVYVGLMRRGSGETNMPPPRTRTDEERPPLEEALHRATLALRTNQPTKAVIELQRAVELDPENVDHTVLLAWAKFCAAADKTAVAYETRKQLVAARRNSDRPQLALFYLGRVERMLGRDKEALGHFQESLELDPSNLEAASEVRVLEARLGGKRR